MGPDGMARNVFLENERRWDAFLLQHVTLVIQFTMLFHCDTNDILSTLHHIFLMHISMDQHGTKSFHGHAAVQKNPVPCFCQVVKERARQVVGIRKTWWNWRNEAITSVRCRRWEVVSRCGSHYGFHIFMVYLPTFTKKNQRNVSK